MHDVTPLDCSRIAQDLQIRKVQVENVVQLLDEGNTIPFITRYRKERTGGLDEEVLRQVQLRINLVRQLAERKQTILKSIDSQGKLNEDLRQSVLGADTMKRLEDLYLPFKPKKRTLATTARERGLDGLALAVWHNDPAVARLDEVLPGLVNPEKELPTPAEVQAGLQHILAEMISETADVRAAVRTVLWETGKICSEKHDKLPEGQGLEYKDYFHFSEALRQIPPHRILALNRGEKEHAIKTHLEWDKDRSNRQALKALAEYLLKKSGVKYREVKEAGVKSQEAAEGSREMAGGEHNLAAPQAATEAANEHPPAADLPATAPPAEGGAATSEHPPAAGQPAPPPPAVAVAEALVSSLTPAPPGEVVPVEGEPLSPESTYRTPHVGIFKAVLDDALNRLLLPSLEREIRHELTDEAERHAVHVFARNLRSLLLQPPLHHRRVLAIDPGFRTGCKVAALDEFGNLLEHAVIYPHALTGKKGKDKAGPGTPPPAAAPAASSQQPASAETPPPAAEIPALAASTPVETAPPPADQPPADSSALPTTQPTADQPPAGQPSAGQPTADQPPAGQPTVDKRAEALDLLYGMVARHQLNVIAIGNGTACRETEEFVSELIGNRLPELSYVIANEAGASVYSVSQIGREEFPNFDATLRGTISIGRRLQDPLSELVKIDPQSIGVGLYQHDVKRKDLKESLEGVVESCVNQVGVDLNTASVPLLRHVSGLNQLVAREVVEYRKQHGPFACREQLLNVPNLGPARYQQAAGFLKIPSSTNPLDLTWIHPESYEITTSFLTELGYAPPVLLDRAAQEEFHSRLKAVPVEDMVNKLNVGLPTLQDIIDALLRPGRDPREDLPPPIFKKGILKLENLQAGMELKGTVLNVVDFGAFVDIGLKESGLVHISQMANRYIKSPYDVVSVNDVVTVWVLTVDQDRHRVSLTMIKPGTERKPVEKKPQQPQQPQGRGNRPPRGRRPDGPPPQPGQEQGQPPRRPRRGRGGPPQQKPAAAATSGGGQTAAGPVATPPARETPPAAPPARPSVPPRRKPRREPVKLSQAALEGKVPLRTFGELSALFAAKHVPPAAGEPSPALPPAAAPPPPEPPPPANP